MFSGFVCSIVGQQCGGNVYVQSCKRVRVWRRHLLKPTERCFGLLYAGDVLKKVVGCFARFL